jgi:hypothetical protein
MTCMELKSFFLGIGLPFNGKSILYIFLNLNNFISVYRQRGDSEYKLLQNILIFSDHHFVIKVGHMWDCASSRSTFFFIYLSIP